MKSLCEDVMGILVNKINASWKCMLETETGFLSLFICLLWVETKKDLKLFSEVYRFSHQSYEA